MFESVFQRTPNLLNLDMKLKTTQIPPKIITYRLKAHKELNEQQVYFANKFAIRSRGRKTMQNRNVCSALRGLRRNCQLVISAVVSIVPGTGRIYHRRVEIRMA